MWDWPARRQQQTADRTDRQTDRKWQTSKKIINTYRMDGGGGYKGCGSVEKKKRAGGGLSSLCTTLGLSFLRRKTSGFRRQIMEREDYVRLVGWLAGWLAGYRPQG